ncbi:MAG: hypothetical protein ABF295_03565, partial [Flavobacteriaceae bacterium]
MAIWNCRQPVRQPAEDERMDLPAEFPFTYAAFENIRWMFETDSEMTPLAFSLESLIELQCLILLNTQSITKILWLFGIAGSLSANRRKMKGWTCRQNFLLHNICRYGSKDPISDIM